MERKDVLLEPTYWIAQIQIALYDCAMQFMQKENKNRTELAQILGVSKGYVSQLLSGDYNYSLSKLVETSMAFGFVPKMSFSPIEEELYMDEHANTVVWEALPYKAFEHAYDNYEFDNAA